MRKTDGVFLRSLRTSPTCVTSRRLPFAISLSTHKDQRRSYTRGVQNWVYRLGIIPPSKSNSDPRVRYGYYSLNIGLDQPPGISYPIHWKGNTKDESDIVDLAQALFSSPSHTISDDAEYLGSILATRFPKSGVQIDVFPVLDPKFPTQSLKRADYTFTIPNIHLKSKYNVPPPNCRVSTRWHLPVEAGFMTKPVTISLITEEHSTSNNRDYNVDPELGIGLRKHSDTQEARLGRTHSTLDVHQEVIGAATAYQREVGDVAGFRIAQLAFETADNRYNDERLENVEVTLRQNRTDDQTTSESSTISVSRAQYERSRRSMGNESLQPGWRKAYLALGSNIGDRISMIESACREMTNRGIKVIKTSALYETKPMYLEDQQPFINGACEVESSMGPLELLDTLKEIENHLGRVKTIENGPRTIDLDILMYGKQIIKHDRLVIPHKRMLERGFVLKPLCDLIPHSVPPIPNAIASFQEELDNLPSNQDGLSQLTPLSSHLTPISSQNTARPTHLMAILNLTPDSFSDGGLHSTADPASLLPTLHFYLNQNNPVTILDIGGQSTRPHAPQSSPEEELSRILPTIKCIRSDPSLQKLAVSVDTYRASVAAAAIEAGADIINDVSAGQLDPDMLPTIAKSGCTCILMHMRGTPDSMTKLTDYPDGIIKGVGIELLARVREAEKAGIRRWRIMLDPGIGFAKTQDQNIELLRRLGELRDFEGLRGFPWVVGASRKGFIGKITGVEQASERKWGTAATVAAAIQGGADVVRVHDVQEMGQVVKMADAIWRA